MKNTIVIDLDHPNKKRVEFFLNNVDERLEQVPFDVRSLNHANEIIAGFKFKGKDQSIFITVIFTSSYFKANDIAEANSFDETPNTKWTVNGDILFVVEAVNVDVQREILSFFAGKE